MAPAAREVPLTEFFTSAFGLRIALEIFLYSAAAGLFVVPIFAAVQSWAGEDRRARVVGAVNALNYIFMVGGSLVTMILLQVAGLSEPMALVVLGVANIGAAVYLFRRLPANFLAFFLRVVWRVLFRLEVKGLENLPPPGTREHHRHQSRVVPRRPDHAVADGPAAGVRHRPRHRRALVDQALSQARRRAPARSRPAARRARARQRGARRTAAGDLPGRPHHGHRRPDEDLRRRRPHRRQERGAGHAGQARRPRAHILLAPRRGAGRAAAVPEDDGDLPAAGAARDPRRASRPGAPARRRRRALRHDVGSHLPDLRHPPHAARRVRGVGEIARPVADRGPGPARRLAHVADVSHRRRGAGAQDRRDHGAW